MSFRNITEIKRANKEAGQHYFSPSTMRFFESRVHPGVFGGRYFVTSEQFVNLSQGYADLRRYTIRIADHEGRIDTVGEFQEFATLSEAHDRAKELAATNGKEPTT